MGHLPSDQLHFHELISELKGLKGQIQSLRDEVPFLHPLKVFRLYFGPGQSRVDEVWFKAEEHEVLDLSLLFLGIHS